MQRLSRMRFGLIAALIALYPAARLRADLGVPISQPRPVSADNGLDPIFNYNPVLATDGHGLWVGAWQLSSTVPYAGFEVVFARSLDSGENWSSAHSLNSNAATQTVGDIVPGIATDGQGHWVAVWQSTLPGTGSQSIILTARSIDNAANWGLPKPVNSNFANNTFAELEPAIATDGKGLWIAVWRTGDASSASTTGFDIVYARSADNGATWTPPLPLGSNFAFNATPRIAADGQGHWIIVWSSTDDCFFVRSIDSGVNWSSPAFLNANGPTAASDIDPDIAADGLGHWVAVWSSTDTLGGTIGANRKILVVRSLDNGANWSLPVPLSTPAAPELDSQVALTTDRQGNWAAVWSRANKGADKTDILAARSIDDGASWSGPSAIGTIANGDTSALPRIATDGRGEWVTVWHAQDASFNSHILSAHFGLPDCNQNLIGDPLETAAGISPDINFNGVPDICEVLALPPAQPTGCGGGMCGTGATMFAPLTMLGLVFMGRHNRRPPDERNC